jgi:flagellar hook-associated protein 1 FlgK
VEAAHGRPEDGDSIGGLISALHADLLALREAPADAIRRGEVVAAADELARRFNSVAGATLEARQGAQDALVQEVASANAALAEIASLTDDIRREIGAGRSTAGLEDSATCHRAPVGIARAARDPAGGREPHPDRARRAGAAARRRQPFSVAAATVGPNSWHGGAGTLPGVMLLGQDVTRGLGGGRLAAAAELRDARCRAWRPSSTSPPPTSPPASRRRGCGCSPTAPAGCRTSPAPTPAAR